MCCGSCEVEGIKSQIPPNRLGTSALHLTESLLELTMANAV